MRPQPCLCCRLAVARYINSVHVVQGSAVYAPEKEALLWKIKNFPGGREFMLRCKFGLPSVEAEEETQGRMPPVRVAFEIPYFTVSGIQVHLTSAVITYDLPCELAGSPNLLTPSWIFGSFFPAQEQLMATCNFRKSSCS